MTHGDALTRPEAKYVAGEPLLDPRLRLDRVLDARPATAWRGPAAHELLDRLVLRPLDRLDRLRRRAIENDDQHDNRDRARIAPADRSRNVREEVDREFWVAVAGPALGHDDDRVEELEDLHRADDQRDQDVGRIIGMISRVNCVRKPAPRMRAAFI